MFAKKSLRTKRNRRLFFFLILAVLMLSGAQKVTAQENARVAQLIEGAKKEGSVSIYGSFTGQLQARVEGRKFLNRFKEKYPFIDLQFVNVTGTRVMQRVSTEYRAGRYTADVIATSALYVYPLVKAGLFGRYASPERDAIPANLKDADGYWTSWFVPLYSMAYNTRMVSSQDAPKSFDDLLDPKWKGKKIGIEEGNSLKWFMTHAARVGREKATAYMQRLATQDPFYKSGGGSTLSVQLLVAGEFGIMHAATVHSILDAQAKHAPVAWARTKEPHYAIPALIGIAARSPHPNASRLYIDFVLSQEGQTLLSPVAEVPARKGVETTPAGLLAGMDLYPVRPEAFEKFTEFQQVLQNIYGGSSSRDRG
jgi:iron(III) transport system substrate-binding protein